VSRARQTNSEKGEVAVPIARRTVYEREEASVPEALRTNSEESAPCFFSDFVNLAEFPALSHQLIQRTIQRRKPSPPMRIYEITTLTCLSITYITESHHAA